MRFLFYFLFLFLFLIGSADSQAAKISVVGEEIVLKGEIKSGDYKKFETIYKNASRKSKLPILDGVIRKNRLSNIWIRRIRLQSRGGRIVDALQIGHFIRTRGLDTYVDSTECLSACALIWLGGKNKYRHANSTIGFHQSFDSKTGRATGNSAVGFYLATMDYTYNTARFVTSASPRKIKYLNNGNRKEADIKYVQREFELSNLPLANVGTPKFRADYLNPAEKEPLIWAAALPMKYKETAIQEYIQQVQHRLDREVNANWKMQKMESDYYNIPTKFRAISAHTSNITVLKVCIAARKVHLSCDIIELKVSDVVSAEQITQQ